jgi:hypothetical protein
VQRELGHWAVLVKKVWTTGRKEREKRKWADAGRNKVSAQEPIPNRNIFGFLNPFTNSYTHLNTNQI